MNVAVGIATGSAIWLMGVGDPILWGTVAFLLNYVPIVGPTLGVVIFLLAGLLTIDSFWHSAVAHRWHRRVHQDHGWLPDSGRALSTIMDIPQMALPLFFR
jgi:uncharacterized protein involved in cysteine biosynthesis